MGKELHTKITSWKSGTAIVQPLELLYVLSKNVL